MKFSHLKIFKSRTKNVLFRYFWLEFEKGIATFGIILEFFLKQSFVQKWKSLNLGLKISYLGVLDSNFKKLLSYMQSTPSKFRTCKVWYKKKNPEIWDQKCLIWVFLGWNLKKLLSYLKSLHSSLSNCNVWCKNKNA